jgi:CheY-like chemotaxis protein
MTPLCLVLSDDLLDASRVIGEGKAAGLTVAQCRDSSALLSAMERKPTLVVLDLHNPGLEVDKVVPQLKAGGTKVVAYGSHVDAARLKAARQAGCDEVLPRSAFFAELREGLAAWIEPRRDSVG